MLHKKFFCHPLTIVLATVATCTLSEPASAALFNFSYTSSAGTIAATVDGTLQPDNDTVFVSSIGDLTFNGFPAIALPLLGSYFDSASIGFASVVGQAVLSLSGSILDFRACSDSPCSNSFSFVPPDTFGITTPPVLSFASTGSYGDIPIESFVLANYSLTPASPPSVPEPSAVIGFVAMGGVFLWGKCKKSA